MRSYIIDGSKFSDFEGVCPLKLTGSVTAGAANIITENAL